MTIRLRDDELLTTYVGASDSLPVLNIGAQTDIDSADDAQ